MKSKRRKLVSLMCTNWWIVHHLIGLLCQVRYKNETFRSNQKVDGELPKLFRSLLWEHCIVPLIMQIFMGSTFCSCHIVFRWWLCWWVFNPKLIAELAWYNLLAQVFKVSFQFTSMGWPGMTFNIIHVNPTEYHYRENSNFRNIWKWIIVFNFFY